MGRWHEHRVPASVGEDQKEGAGGGVKSDPCSTCLVAAIGPAKYNGITPCAVQLSGAGCRVIRMAACTARAL